MAIPAIVLMAEASAIHYFSDEDSSQPNTQFVDSIEKGNSSDDQPETEDDEESYRDRLIEQRKALEKLSLRVEESEYGNEYVNETGTFLLPVGKSKNHFKDDPIYQKFHNRFHSMMNLSTVDCSQIQQAQAGRVENSDNLPPEEPTSESSSESDSDDDGSTAPANSPVASDEILSAQEFVELDDLKAFQSDFYQRISMNECVSCGLMISNADTVVRPTWEKESVGNKKVFQSLEEFLAPLRVFDIDVGTSVFALYNEGGILSPSPYSDNRQPPERICLCWTCDISLRAGKIPSLSKAAGHFFDDESPACLSSLRPLELALVAPANIYVQVHRLRSGGQYCSTGSCTTVYNNNLSSLKDKLPRNVEDCLIVFQEDLERARKDGRGYAQVSQRCIRPEKVLAALDWLVKNNDLYKDRLIDKSEMERLERLSAESQGEFDVHEKAPCKQFDEKREKTGDEQIPAEPREEGEKELADEEIPILSMTRHLLPQLNDRRSEQEKVRVLLSRGRERISDYDSDVPLLALSFPELFPYGTHSIERFRFIPCVSPDRVDFESSRLSGECSPDLLVNLRPWKYQTNEIKIIRHLLQLRNPRFRQHLLFMFFVYNTRQRMLINSLAAIASERFRPVEHREELKVADVQENENQMNPTVKRAIESMVPFADNFKGSTPYWNQKRRELFAMNASIGVS